MSEPMVDTDNLTAHIDPDKAAELRELVGRVERLEMEKGTVQEDIKAVYAQAKADGWNSKTIRQIVKLRRTDERTLQEEETLLTAYKIALDMD